MKLVSLIAASMLLGAASLAQALEIQPFSAAALAQAEKADQAVALHFHADWCPTCRAQAKVLEQLKSEPGLELTVLVASYDDEKALKRRFNVRSQSTLIALHGDKERARMIGDTTAEGIRRVLKAAL